MKRGKTENGGAIAANVFLFQQILCAFAPLRRISLARALVRQPRVRVSLYVAGLADGEVFLKLRRQAAVHY